MYKLAHKWPGRKTGVWAAVTTMTEETPKTVAPAKNPALIKRKPKPTQPETGRYDTYHSYIQDRLFDQVEKKHHLVSFYRFFSYLHICEVLFFFSSNCDKETEWNGRISSNVAMMKSRWKYYEIKSKIRLTVRTHHLCTSDSLSVYNDGQHENPRTPGQGL